MQLLTNIVPNQAPISGFMKNGKVDLNKCLNEVHRRSSEIGCNDFECSPERFIALATENGELNDMTSREAITVLQVEMLGYYKNARREYYGPNIKGPDFLAEGLGEFENIIHVEVKNLVGSAIKTVNDKRESIRSINRQRKQIGKKLVYQQNYWSSTTMRSKFKNLKPTL